MLGRVLDALMSRTRARKAEAGAGPAQFDEEFAAIFARAAIGITLTDGRGKFLRVNPAFERFLGYAPGELTGTQVRNITHPEDWEKDTALFNEIRRGERDSYQLEKRYVRKDRSLVWGRLIASGVRRGPDGSLYGVGMIEDIDEQRRTEQQLAASRAQLERLNTQLKLYIEQAPLACIVWGVDQIVREWNPSAEAMYGYSAAEAIGQNVYELTGTPSGLAVVDEVRANMLAGGAYPEGVVVENRRKDHTRLQVHWRFAVVGRGTADEAVVAFGVDVTDSLRAAREREMLEIGLRQAQKMQSLGTLAGGIAHDFNNILLAISGNTKLAVQELPHDHTAQAALAEVSKASARAAGIVKQILAFSRTEEAAHAPLDLRQIVEESLRLIRASLPASVTIRSRCERAHYVRGDAGQLHQVMVNLATNAAYAMREKGGVLEVELDEVVPRARTGAVAADGAGRLPPCPRQRRRQRHSARNHRANL